MKNSIAPKLGTLHAELHALITSSRQRLGGAVNAELTRLYWPVSITESYRYLRLKKNIPQTLVRTDVFSQHAPRAWQEKSSGELGKKKPNQRRVRQSIHLAIAAKHFFIFSGIWWPGKRKVSSAVDASMQSARSPYERTLGALKTQGRRKIEVF